MSKINLSRSQAYMISAILVAAVGFNSSAAVAVAPAKARSVPAHGEAWASAPAEYLVRVLQLAPPRLRVTASIPVNGSALTMDTTRPGDVPEVGENGWPALVRNLRAVDALGRSIDIAGVSRAGWELKQVHAGRITLEYEVDYSVLAGNGWPAMREAAYADPEHFAFIGRSLFVTTPEVHASRVAFALPRPWRAVVPWTPIGSSEGTSSFSADSAPELAENFIVLTPSTPEVVRAAGFRVFVTAMGHWRDAADDVGAVLSGVMPRFVAMFGFKESARYSVVLLPLVDFGGESFRNSFALTVDSPPGKSNRAAWGRIIAYEIFHYWNGSRLRGADYAGSQWFQEGFTDYAADLAMVASGLTKPGDFMDRLAADVRNYQKLTTPLDAPGTHKGPPLYGGGALVAFCWDVGIRQATGNRRDLGDLLRTLWRQMDGGNRGYEWSDIRTALDSVAHLDWDAFYRAYIHGSEKLPLDEVFHLAGLRSVRLNEGEWRIEPDPLADTSARALWRKLVGARPGT